MGGVHQCGSDWSVVIAPDQHLGGHRFKSFLGLTFSLSHACSTLYISLITFLSLTAAWEGYLELQFLPFLICV